MNPRAGELVVQSYAKVKGVKFPVSGVKKVWNFTKLKDSAKLDSIYFVNSSSTPYGSQFPSSNVAAYESDIRGSYVYYTTDNSALSVNGSASKKSSVTWTPSYRIIAYPFTYGSKFFDASTITSNGSTISYQYTDTVVAVGYGTLKLPNKKTYRNALMTKTTSAISFTAGGHTTTTFSYSISYIAKGSHYPLLTIDFDDTNTIEDISYTVASAGRADKIIDETENKTAITANRIFTVYPNPATTSFTINAVQKNGKTITAIIVNDISGKTVLIKKENITAAENINCSSLKPGIYFVRIQMNDGSELAQKLIITK